MLNGVEINENKKKLTEIYNDKCVPIVDSIFYFLNWEQKKVKLWIFEIIELYYKNVKANWILKIDIDFT